MTEFYTPEESLCRLHVPEGTPCRPVLGWVSTAADGAPRLFSYILDTGAYTLYHYERSEIRDTSPAGMQEEALKRLRSYARPELDLAEHHRASSWCARPEGQHTCRSYGVGGPTVLATASNALHHVILRQWVEQPGLPVLYAVTPENEVFSVQRNDGTQGWDMDVRYLLCFKGAGNGSGPAGDFDIRRALPLKSADELAAQMLKPLALGQPVPVPPVPVPPVPPVDVDF